MLVFSRGNFVRRLALGADVPVLAVRGNDLDAFDFQCFGSFVVDSRFDGEGLAGDSHGKGGTAAALSRDSRRGSAAGTIGTIGGDRCFESEIE